MVNINEDDLFVMIKSNPGNLLFKFIPIKIEKILPRDFILVSDTSNYSSMVIHKDAVFKNEDQIKQMVELTKMLYLIDLDLYEKLNKFDSDLFEKLKETHPETYFKLMGENSIIVIDDKIRYRELTLN